MIVIQLVYLLEAVGGVDITLCFIELVGDAVELGRLNGPAAGSRPATKMPVRMKVFVTDGVSCSLTGLCVNFVRCNNTIEITNSNIAQV